MQPFEQEGAAPRVGAQQPDDAVAVPVLQGERLVLGLVVPVEAHLEHGGLAVGRADRRHQRAEAVPEVVALAGQLPLVEDVGGRAAGSRSSQRGPVGTEAALLLEAGGQGERHARSSWHARVSVAAPSAGPWPPTTSTSCAGSAWRGSSRRSTGAAPTPSSRRSGGSARSSPRPPARRTSGWARACPGVTHAAVTEAYESWRILRGSNIRGTVHTSTADDQAAARRDHAGRPAHALAPLPAAGPCRAGRRLGGDRGVRRRRVAYAGRAHRASSPPGSTSHGETEAVARMDNQAGRYFAFGHGGLRAPTAHGRLVRPGRPRLPHGRGAAARPSRPRRPRARGGAVATSRPTVRPAATTSPGGRGSGCARSTRSSSGST